MCQRRWQVLARSHHQDPCRTRSSGGGAYEAELPKDEPRGAPGGGATVRNGAGLWQRGLVGGHRWERPGNNALRMTPGTLFRCKRKHLPQCGPHFSNSALRRGDEPPSPTLLPASRLSSSSASLHTHGVHLTYFISFAALIPWPFREFPYPWYMCLLSK